MFEPTRTYRDLVGQPGATGALTLLRRPLFVALILGVVATLSATGRLTLGLVASSALCWSFVPAVQLLSLIVVAAVIARPTLPVSRAADLFFIGHAPWSLWMLTVAAAAAVGFPEGTAGWPEPVRTLVLASAVVPFAWTAVLTSAFFREVVGLSARRAKAATALHGALVWSVAVLYVFVVTQLWPRLLGLR